MGILLARGDQKLPLANRIWEILLVLAVKYGWEPHQGSMGDATTESTVGDWRDKYIHGAGREVNTADAANMANALEAALKEIPDDDGEAEADVHTNVAGLPVSPYELFRGDGKQVIRELIQFCRDGGFRIQ